MSYCSDTSIHFSFYVILFLNVKFYEILVSSYNEMQSIDLLSSMEQMILTASNIYGTLCVWHSAILSAWIILFQLYNLMMMVLLLCQFNKYRKLRQKD